MLNRAVVVALWLLGAVTIARVGVLYAAMFTMSTGTVPVAWGWDNLRLSLWYTVPVLGILAVHEGGHWWAARSYGVKTWGPYLVPWPMALAVHLPWLPALGTLGAGLRFKGALPSAVAEWDIAFTGLCAGMAATVACTLLGAYWSVPVTGRGPWSRFWVPRVVSLVAGEGVAYHPLLMAARLGWALGVFSLIPIRPFDGGRLLWNVVDVWGARRWQVWTFAALCACCWVY